MDDYFDSNPLAYWALITQMLAATFISIDFLIPMTVGAKIISHGMVIVGAAVAAGVWAQWLWKNPPYIPFAMDFPSGWNVHRPLILCIWLAVALWYAVDIAKMAGWINIDSGVV